MWKIENPKFEKTTLDFSSSGQANFQATRLISDGVEIMNAVELIDWDDDKIQLSICDHCGTVQCASGGWVVFRASGDLVFMMPAFEAMKEEDWSKTEFSPPYFIQDKGVAYLHRQTYELLREQFSEFPVFEKIKSLQMREAMWLVQWNAPMRIFGEPPNLEIHNYKFDCVVAASEGNPKEIITEAENLLRENFENETSAYLRQLLENEKSIWLFLDATEFIDWQVMILSQGKYKFVIDNEFVVEGRNFPNLD